jgi:hypothetical protein
MKPSLYAGAGMWDISCNNLSRQQGHHPTRIERKDIKWTMHQTHQCNIFVVDKVAEGDIKIKHTPNAQNQNKSLHTGSIIAV